MAGQRSKMLLPVINRLEGQSGGGPA